MERKNSSLWVEKYRPQHVKDIVMPKKFKTFFNKIVETGDVPNLLLTSPVPGTGKSTIAKAIINDLEADYVYINASSENSIELIRKDISDFAQTTSFTGKQKIVILDEADGLSAPFQKALRAFIEEFESNCRFILTCNYIAKIIPALRQGRTQVFDFNMSEYKEELIPQMVTRIAGILKHQKIEYDADVLPKLVETYFPSMRQVIATLQQYAQMNDKIDEGILSYKEIGSELAEMIMSKKKVSEIRAYIEQQGMSFSDVFHNLFETFVPMCSKKPQSILLLAEYEYRCGFSTDTTLQIAACIVELMGCV